MASVTLNITGMHCSHCETKVSQALTGRAGVWSASVDLTSASAAVDYDDRQVTVEQLVAAVREAGYGAQPAG